MERAWTTQAVRSAAYVGLACDAKTSFSWRRSLGYVRFNSDWMSVLPTAKIVNQRQLRDPERPFDLGKLQVAGAPTPVVEGVWRADGTMNGGADGHLRVQEHSRKQFFTCKFSRDLSEKRV
jgi:hypothetical protein